LEIKNTIKAGSYLERHIDLGPESFYLSIDGHQVLYRKNNDESTLIIGSATTIGAFEASDIQALNELFLKLKALLTIDVGEFKDFQIITGLRHKGPKRMMICESLNDEKSLFRINGLYKNGYTMGFLAGKKMAELILN
jgi:glycine/D-amino acid oxidase-like deaminating enzyme